jgi:hypothetical protein
VTRILSSTDLDALVERRPATRKFSPGAIRRIRRSLESFQPVRPCSPESLYQEILAIFLEHSQTRGPRDTGNADAWLRFVPAEMRLEISLIVPCRYFIMVYSRSHI